MNLCWGIACQFFAAKATPQMRVSFRCRLNQGLPEISMEINGHAPKETLRALPQTSIVQGNE